MPSPNRNIDGGWAYMVAIGTFVCFFLTNGFARSFGIMYSAFLVTFRQSDSTTSLLLGVRSVCAIVAGPLSTSLSERFTERKVVIAGAIITSLGFSLSFFATSLEFLIVTIGLLMGVGITLVFAPIMVAMGKYFDKMRSRAITLTSCGGCVGMIVVPILLQKLIEMYSVRGALLIYGGLSLHLVIAGAVIRPMVVNVPALIESTSESADNKLLEGIEVNVDPISNSACEDSDDKNQELHNLEMNEQAVKEMTIEEQHKIKMISDTLQETGVVCSFLTETSNSEEPLFILHPADHVGVLEYNQQEDSSDIDCFIERLQQSGEIQAGGPGCNSESDRNSFQSIRKDSDLVSKRKCGGHLKRLFLSAFRVSQFSILGNPLFIIILISGTLSGIPYACMTMYLVPLVESNGISRDSAAILLSVIGVTDIVGRIVCGGLADKKPIQPQHIMIIFGILGGILCSLLAVVSDFYGFLGILIPYGIVCSSPTILIMPATVNLIGISELPKAVGVLMFFFGVFTSIAPYFLGLLKDYTGSYRTIFPILGCLSICSSLVLLLEGVLKRRLGANRNGNTSTPDS